MRQIFQGYYRPSEEDFAALWRQSMFVLDASVLLNLYRYPQQARTDFLNLLKQIQDRLWVPHQAALEYQENRLRVIAEQVKRFTELRKVIIETQNRLRVDIENLQLAKRHSSINPENILARIKEVFDSFTKELDELEKGQPDVYDNDLVRDNLDRLLEGRVGSPPESQKDLDEIYQNGKLRYALKRPPGYRDTKDKEEDDVYTKDNLVFRRRYGDLILWSELLKQAKTNQRFKHMIFVTDDQKEDWWWLIESRGNKTIGPRPELISEMLSLGEARSFYMYTPERFLELAKSNLGAQVKEESIKQVRDIGLAQKRIRSADTRHWGLLAEQAVLLWLCNEFSDWSIAENERGFPDFIVTREGARSVLGFEVKIVRDPQWAFRVIQDVQYRAHFEIGRGQLTELNLILVIGDESEAERLHRVLNRMIPERPGGIRYLVGMLTFESGSDAPEFILLFDM